MIDQRFDAVVVGSGPGGAVTAVVLARGGARVALVDKATFPRDKACGDVVGPRGVQLLEDLKLDTGADAGVRVGDMVVVGPTGRRVRLPCFEGRSYPGYGTAVTRRHLDARLAAAALDAGAHGVTGRFSHLLPPVDNGSGAGCEPVGGVELDDGRRLRAPVVIGADGATSAVAEAAGLVDARRVLWGFAVRVYLDQPVALPHIVLWEPEPRRPFPGYGWLFPGPGGTANAGLGMGTLADRRTGSGAVRLLPTFLQYLREAGLLDSRPDSASGRLGGWLKMGMVGTTPASGGVLLVGDAAGLVNPLQGEGIAQAMTSGRMAAEAVLAGAGSAAARYRAAVGLAHLRYHRVAASAHAALVGRPAAAATVGRLLTLPAVGPALAGGWSVYWNELLDGATPGRARATASAAAGVGHLVTARSSIRDWLVRAWDRSC